MKIIRDTQRNCARMAAEEYRKLLNENPHCVLGLATGSTPEMLYEELVALCKAGKLSFKDVTTYNLDEYVGLDGSHPQSYRYFMDSHLFNLVDIDKTRTHVPCGVGVTDEMAAHYDEIKQAGGVDLQLLGIGPNGHIGFNEPGTPWDAVTHIVPLTDATRQANKRFFNSIDEVPEKAVSMGIKTVQTNVGDRYVLEEMMRGDYSLGGEQSGHIIFLEHNTTGDGLVTALQLLAVLKRTGRTLTDLAGIMKKYPQVLVNVHSDNKAGLDDCQPIWDAVAAAEKELDGRGRILVRPSGTEPLVRVMAEAETHELTQRVVDDIVEVVKRELP